MGSGVDSSGVQFISLSLFIDYKELNDGIGLTMRIKVEKGTSLSK